MGASGRFTASTIEAAPLAARMRSGVGQHICPPILGRRLKRARPRAAGHDLARLQHRSHEHRNAGALGIKPDEVWLRIWHDLAGLVAESGESTTVVEIAPDTRIRLIAVEHIRRLRVGGVVISDDLRRGFSAQTNLSSVARAHHQAIMEHRLGIAIRGPNHVMQVARNGAQLRCRQN